MEQNDLILDYIRSMFPDKQEKEIMTLLWRNTEGDLEEVLLQILESMEENNDQV